MRFINSKYIYYLLVLPAFLGAVSCVDDSLPSTQGKYDPAQDPDMVCLPFSISFRGDNTSAETRGNENQEGEKTRADGFLDGTDLEHKMDFDTPNECFAIFLEGDKVRYIRPLYIVEQLEEGSTNNDKNIEYTVPVITYIPQDDVEKVEGKNYFKPKLTNILVVLNGGPIYNKIHNKIYNSPNGGDNDVKSNVTLNDIMNITWSNAADYEGDDLNDDREGSDGRIGFNSKELYTMTNSAYYDNKDNLMTATPITGFAYASIKDYVENEEKNPTNVYVERMVCKFSAPTFSTQVIGSDRVFRPDDKAMPIVIYSWDGSTLLSSQKNWRIHLLGWAINGDESESYLFKHIPSNTSEEEAVEKSWWNDPQNYRSYWSIDPHYNSDAVKNDIDFYPWQFRRASDRDDIISIQAGLNQGTKKIPSLRYNSFTDILNEWQWRNTLHIHENTFDPRGDWYNIYENEEQNKRNPSNLDGRAPILAGPHLLVAAELYLEKPGGRYINQFDTVMHIYSDRIRRFYLNEQSWLKMFTRDFNRALVAQERMSFPVYDWDGQSSGKANNSYVATPSGECRLFLRQVKSRYVQYDADALEIEGKEVNYNGVTTDFVYTELTYKAIDNLLKDPKVHFSTPANARNGDGRLLPWISKDGMEWMDFGLIVRNPKGEKLPFRLSTEDESVKRYDWTYDMYMSMFYEWFGPIDHYYNGFMYYAGEIKHHNTNITNSANYYGTVRNHWYKFRVEAINSLGIPVDDPGQLIIPGNYNYRDQIIVYLDIIGWHSRETVVDFENQ